MTRQSKRAKRYRMDDDIRCLYVSVLKNNHKVKEQDRFINCLDSTSVVIRTRGADFTRGNVLVLISAKHQVR